MTYISTKTYGHEIGLSCCFRQHRAESHCRFLHGYSLSVKLEFEAQKLNENNWVVDFGGLKTLKEWLVSCFDHKMLVAKDDPEIDELRRLNDLGIADMVVVPDTGCEAFAHLIFQRTRLWLKNNEYDPRVKLRSVEVREHGANSAIYFE